MKKLLVMAGILSVALTACGNKETAAPAESAESVAQAETLTGKANGFGGEMVVEVVREGNTIKEVKIVSNCETEGVGSNAIDALPAEIVKANSVEVDDVSGATVSSKAIRDAVNNALDPEKYPYVEAAAETVAETEAAETTEENAEIAPKADGIYKAETDDATVEMDYGYRDTLEVEYKDGKIVAVTFESYDKDGNKKSEVDPATYPMDPAPADWIPQMQENILKAGVSSEVDAVSGATNSSSNAVALLKAIEKDGVAGETLSVNNTNR